jgi:hypothetical protein
MKPRPNHRIYLQALRDMSPEQRLRKAFELSRLSRALFREGLKALYPDLPEEEFHRLYLSRLQRSWDRTD